MKDVIGAAVVNWAFWLLVSHCKAAGSAEAYGQTTLEQAMNLAYNAKIRDGTWASIFGRDSLRSFRAVRFVLGQPTTLPEVKPDFDFKSFPRRAATARVTLFRATDFTNMEIIGDPYHA